MKPPLLALFLFVFFNNCFSQSSLVQLHLRKNGRIKKRIELGSSILIHTRDNRIAAGAVIKLRKDSIYFNRVTVAVSDIDRVKLPRTKPKMKFDLEEFGYVSLGVGLATAGLTLAKWQEFPESLSTACAIGYSPYFFRFVKSISLKKRKFKMKKKYSLRIWDIR
jgi:hypothetical protein